MISTTTNKVQYDISSSVPASFSIPFKFWEEAEIIAVITLSDGTDITLTITTNYTLSAPDDTGTLTRVGTWDTDAVRLTIYREVSETQETDYVENGITSMETLEADFDKAVARVQQLSEALARSVRLPITDPSGASMTLPTEAERASKHLAFDASGNAIASEGVPSVPVTTFMETVLDDATGADALETIVTSATEVVARETLGVFGIKETIEYSKTIGELFFVDGAIKAPAGYTAGTPRTYWPALCLDDIDTYEDLDEANWPDFVPFLRAKKYKYLEGLTGAVEDFESATYQVAANVVTLTLANNAANIALVAALAEEYALTGYRQVINIPIAIGPITAGDYLITGYNTGSRQVTFAFTTGNTGPSATSQVVTFHANRIVGSTTTARVYGAKALAVMSAGTATHISGGMRRSYYQGHNLKVYINKPAGSIGRPAADTGDRLDSTSGPGAEYGFTASTHITDGVNGTPREGLETEPRSITAHLYEWAGSYIAP